MCLRHFIFDIDISQVYVLNYLDKDGYCEVFMC